MNLHFYQDYFDFLEKYNILNRLKNYDEINFVVLTNRQMEYEMNMLEEIDQKETLLAHIVCPDPLCKSIISKDGNLIYNSNIKVPIQKVESFYDLNQIIHLYTIDHVLKIPHLQNFHYERFLFLFFYIHLLIVVLYLNVL